LINEILQALNSKKVVGGIFCDLEKVFDSVNHDILLCKLNFCGIRGPFHELLKSYLTNRYQGVIIGGRSSSSVVFRNGAKLIMVYPGDRYRVLCCSCSV